MSTELNGRQQNIVTLLERHGEITIKELAARLGVSEMTVHRDLDRLQGLHLLYKKRGAAAFVERVGGGLGFYAEEKRAIGLRAAEEIPAGATVVFDNSTTALECARCLTEPRGLTLCVTGLDAMNALADSGNIVYCCGGYYFRDSKGYVGSRAEEFVASLRTDVCVIGASGISADGSLTAPYPAHTALQRKILDSAARRILVADHSKFGRTALERFGSLKEIDLLVTDSATDPADLERCRAFTEVALAK